MCSWRQSDLPSCSRTMAGSGTCCRERSPPRLLPSPLPPTRARPAHSNPAYQRGEGLLCAWKPEQPRLSLPRDSPIGLRPVAAAHDQLPLFSRAFQGRPASPTTPPPSRPYPSHAAAAQEGAPLVAGIPPQSAAARGWVGGRGGEGRGGERIAAASSAVFCIKGKQTRSLARLALNSKLAVVLPAVSTAAATRLVAASLAPLDHCP